MCGIVGYIGERSAISVLLDGLQHLEYRGYDSAGVAVIQDDQVVTHRSVGKLCNLVQKVDRRELHGTIGIGHTRWATHGRPTEANAHPHQEGRVVLVHNGIIENYIELRSKLLASGHSFTSETDTEILCHLISDQLKGSVSMQSAISKALSLVEGSYAIVVMDTEDTSRLYFARQGSPLVVGLGKKETILASDVPAILSYTRRMVFLEDGDRGHVTAKQLVISDARGKSVSRKVATIDWDPVMAEKGGFKHFMLKEIFEQPKVIGDTLASRVSVKEGVILPELLGLLKSGKLNVDHVQFVACGTSWHAAGVARYWIESLCKIPVSVDLASEFRYRNPVVGKKTLCVAISQSGETADTLAAAQLAKRRGARLLAVCNVQGSSITRLAHATLYTRAGPEIGVASTKAFTTQLVVLLLLSLWMGMKLKRISLKQVISEARDLKQLPGLVQKSLDSHPTIRDLAKKYVNASPVLFIGRGAHYPVVLEGALKLKEIAYIHAEGFAAGELKHGPIALVDQDVPVIALLPQGEILEKMISNIQEVMARGASVLMVGDKASFPKGMGSAHIDMPKSSEYLTPILYVIPLQLFAYDVADLRGTDIDQPRNLAKSVTVE